MFAIPRTSGWMAQWLEMTSDEEQRIARPRQIYDGHRQRDFVPLDQRGTAEPHIAPSERFTPRGLHG